MAGHNKWSKVKHIKGAADAKRSKLFSKLAKEITVAAREGGGDVDLNARLRQAVANARKQSLPGDTIDRAIKKGTGEIEGAAFEEACYEGYGPGGVAMLVEVITDNKNRAVSAIRSIFNKGNGSIADSGSVAYLFEHKGEIRLPASAGTETEIMELAVECGAEDLASDEDGHMVLTAHDELAAVAEKLAERGVELDSQQLVYLPKTTVEISDPSIAKQVLRLFSNLDDYEDTQNVFANFDLSQGVLEEAGV